MLPVKNLDDLLFKDMVENAKKMIPGLTDEWNNTSSSDPGITFIELFAWLLEMQHYYLNGISTKNKSKYLKILGEKVQHDKPSHGVITLKNVKNKIVLPSKCKFAAGNIIFETEMKENIYPITIKEFFSTENNTITNTSKNNWEKEYYMFGMKPSAGNTFIICFDAALPLNENVDIMLNILDDYPVRRNPIMNEKDFYPLAKVNWEYYTSEGWEEIQCIKDTTLNFIKSGVITFNLDKSMKFCDRTNSYMIRAVLKESFYDVPPVLKYISTNSINVVQKNTLAECIEFTVTRNNAKIILSSYLSIYGYSELYVKEKDKTLKRIYKYDFTEYDNFKIIKLDEIFKEYYKDDKLRVLVCSYDKEFYSKKSIGSADGFPNFFIPISLDNILYEDFEIWISKDLERGIYEKWDKCDDLYLESKTDKKYFLDLINKKIIFGDGINGRIPEGEIIVTGLSTTIANKGNVKSGEINKILIDNSYGMTAFNREHSCGGEKSPSVDDYIKIVRKKLKETTRAVTDDDYEYIVKSTPGLMVKNAKVIIQKQNSEIFSNDNPNTVYIAVESYKRSFQKREKLNRAYIKNIRNYLEQYRLITTEIEVISPEYISIDIQGEIRVNSYFKEAQNIIKERIMNYFNNKKWEFGKGILYSDLYGIINTISFVKKIYSLSINFSGIGAVRNESLDITIPPNGIVVLENCEINVSDY